MSVDFWKKPKSLRLAFDNCLDASVVILGSRNFQMRRTPKLGLREVEFIVGRRTIDWSRAKSKDFLTMGKVGAGGKKVMQFVEDGRYIGVVVDGKAALFKR